jgi:hypothetical protein
MRRGVRIAACAVSVLVLVAAVAFIVMELWNFILPAAAGWHPITYWQALGLLILSKILFGSFRRGYGPPWKKRMLQRYASMTPEEREKFREGMRGRCAEFGHRTAESKT